MKEAWLTFFKVYNKYWTGEPKFDKLHKETFVKHYKVEMVARQLLWTPPKKKTVCLFIVHCQWLSTTTPGPEEASINWICQVLNKFAEMFVQNYGSQPLHSSPSRVQRSLGASGIMYTGLNAHWSKKVVTYGGTRTSYVYMDVLCQGRHTKTTMQQKSSYIL